MSRVNHTNPVQQKQSQVNYALRFANERIDAVVQQHPEFAVKFQSNLDALKVRLAFFSVPSDSMAILEERYETLNAFVRKLIALLVQADPRRAAIEPVLIEMKDHIWKLNEKFGHAGGELLAARKECLELVDHEVFLLHQALHKGEILHLSALSSHIKKTEQICDDFIRGDDGMGYVVAIRRCFRRINEQRCMTWSVLGLSQIQSSLAELETLLQTSYVVIQQYVSTVSDVIADYRSETTCKQGGICGFFSITTKEDDVCVGHLLSAINCNAIQGEVKVEELKSIISNYMADKKNAENRLARILRSHGFMSMTSIETREMANAAPKNPLDVPLLVLPVPYPGGQPICRPARR